MSSMHAANLEVMSQGQSQLAGLRQCFIKRDCEEFMSLDKYVDWDDLPVSKEAQKAFKNALGFWAIKRNSFFWDREDFPWGKIFADRYIALYDLENSGCRSPIESIFGAWLIWLDGEPFGAPWIDGGFLFDNPSSLPQEETHFFITPQASIDSYEVDFCISLYARKKWSRFVIECDGHDFHEKTKEQAARDKRRDRVLVTEGFPVMRFTGSEIFRNPESCYEQVQSMVSKIAVELW